MKSENKEMIQLNSDINNITEVESFIDSIVDRFNVAPEIYGNILISITEAVTNAIVHGNDSDLTKKVHINMQKNEKDIVFRVSDEGSGFDHATLPDPTAPENLLTIGGRGVFMIKQLCDDVAFHDNGSTVEMRFRVENA